MCSTMMELGTQKQYKMGFGVPKPIVVLQVDPLGPKP